MNHIIDFVNKHPGTIQPVVVTKLWDSIGLLKNCMLIPLPMFLLFFD